MQKRVPLCIHAFLAMVWAFIALAVQADQAAILGPNGQPANFPQVTVESAARGTDGQLVFMVVPNPGQPAAPLPIARIQTIAFGASGEGRPFDMTLATDGGGTSFHPGTTLLQFANGQFTAIPTGGTQPFPVAAARIVSLAAVSVQLSPTPAPFGQPESFSDASPDAGDGMAADDFADGADPSGGDFTAEDFESLSAEDKGMAAAILGGGLLILGAIGLWFLSYLVTLIWLIVWAIKEGDISGVFVMLCCTFGKWYYAFSKYTGPGRPAMQIINAIEVLGWVVLMIANVALGG